MSKYIRTKNVKKEKAVDKIKKVSDYKAESGNSFGASSSKSDAKGSGKSKA